MLDAPSTSRGTLDLIRPISIQPEALGAPGFREKHGIRFAYLSGAMYKGIASVPLVIRMGKAGLLGYFGTGGLFLERIEEAILEIKKALGPGQVFGMNLLCNLIKPEYEDATVDLFLRLGINRIEAAAYTQVTASLIRYRLAGVTHDPDHRVVVPNHVLAKISRPEVAAQFLSPPPDRLVQKLLAAGRITQHQASLAPRVSMADDICVEADSGGHTDNGVASTLLPVMLRLRDEAMTQHRFDNPIFVGAAGGIGTPHAVAASFIMGVDFVLTGSINQCTVEAGTSDLAKDLLASANVQDTEMAPAGDMFEIGAKVQVLSKGLFFPARASKLYELYKRHESLDEIDAKTREQLETRYFKRTFDQIFEETRSYYGKIAPEQITRAEKNPKFKMALVFRWYFVHSTRLALSGDPDGKLDFQIHCGPALGSFNQWVRGTRLEDWRNRHSDEMGEMLMKGAAELLTARFRQLTGAASLL